MTEIIPGLEEIAARYHTLEERVREAEVKAGRESESVSIELAVKYQSLARVRAALDAGAQLLGHNLIHQLEEGESGLHTLTSTPPCTHRTHVIGHVQSNKAGKALAWAQCIETVDTLKLAERLNRLQGERIARGEATDPFDIMVQVNSSGAPSQYGVDPALAEELVGAIAALPHLRPIGLMTIGAHTENVGTIAHSFSVVRELRESLRRAGYDSLVELSMGMTHDLDIAIAEGSTIIRVGTAVFGPRLLV